MKKTLLLSLTWPLFLTCFVFAQAQESPENAERKFDAEIFAGLNLRSIGPALMSGRIADLAIDQQKPNTWYVAVGSGNVWKTTNAGVTWQAIFDNYSSYSIGCLTIDPSHSSTIWVGTGENVGGRHVGFGDGVYVSLDAGKSFQHKGLKESEHIGKILVDPRDAKTIFVACQGPLWTPGRERGLYKSSDGGNTWKQVLSKGEYTGVTDVVFDPTNPDVLYAATHQRHRNVWALINAGPESGIFKSTDSGETWQPLTNGLPGEDKGKIGLQVSPQQANVVYATIELPGRKGGFWRSEDFGNSWQKMSDFISGGTGPHYYQEIFCDPHRFDVIYQVSVQLSRSEDGGKTWQTVEGSHKHVDNHAIAFSPHDPDFLLVGCDGGLYQSYDYAQTFAYTANLPLTQFYKLDLDNDYPFYHVVGGTQDNNTQYGPVRTNNVQGITNADWRITIGGDGHDNAIDPEDPNIIYCESQQGYLRRYDRKTGEAIDIRPRPDRGEEDFRFNWDSPILISPHAHTRLYFGSKHLHRSDDRGDSWTKVSPDLSRGLDRYNLKTMGSVRSIDAAYDFLAMSQYGNITSISESPLVPGLLYVGTDDGLIQVSEDGGKHWRKIDKIYGVPEFAFVNDVKADLHDPDTVYALFDNHKTGDFKPYIVKSTDRGRSWESMVGDLPVRHLVWRIVQDHVRADLFFLGTEFGLFFTLDGGQKWLKLKNGAPTIPFRDLAIQRRENDLVGATFGRGFYVLDDYSPLRDATAAVTEKELHIFPIRDALWYVQSDRLGGQKGFQGDSYYNAPNPEYGATFTYFVRDTIKTKKDLRREAEEKIKQASGDVKPPDWETVRAEELEEPPALYFEITDLKGQIVNRVNGSPSRGLQRATWNLRYAGYTAGDAAGPLAAPGKYQIRAYRRHGDKVTALGEAVQFEVVSIVDPALPPQNRQQVLAFQAELGKLQNTLVAAQRSLGKAIEEIGEMKNALRTSPRGSGELAEEARELELKLKESQRDLAGDEIREARYVESEPSIMDRLQTSLENTINNTYGPTKTQRQQYQIALEQYAELSGPLKKLIEVKLPAFAKKLDDAGIPWTSGRKIPEFAR